MPLIFPLDSASPIRSQAQKTTASRLQLSLAGVLGLLHDGVELGGLHDVALDLELAGHEQALGVGLALDQVAKVLLGEGQGDCVCGRGKSVQGVSQRFKCVRRGPWWLREAAGCLCACGAHYHHHHPAREEGEGLKTYR